MRAFYNLTDFPDMQTIQQNYLLIQEELFQNQLWINWNSDSYNENGKCHFLGGNWTICPIYFGNYDGSLMNIQGLDPVEAAEIISTLPSKFPKITQLFKPFKQINFAAFSRLHAKSKLEPHRHKNPFSMIFHLGVVIPDGALCGLQVGSQTHIWTKPGDAVIFDDTITHSAWNDSNEDRIVLYIDFMRFY